ncbi:hypothetical protein PCASD_18314 [Puccinia coronata f. sp. avenae]|uniref:N-alpha-acetyltransferase 40 n=1 Tax=Puccinia coronata f. sp. avenae TaxID=200324 RepID=A0A2N5S7L8_9BASI|nr:hypothetical protein PCASD_18314 [Puccinia coronata f. sp. avenae]
MLDPVDIANRASSTSIALKIGYPNPKFHLTLDDNTSCTFHIQSAHELSPQTRSQCFHLFESNMKQIYLRSADGYRPSEKERELFHPDARFLLASHQGQRGGEEEDDHHQHQHQQHETEGIVDGFLMWRFDWEECMSVEEGELEVAYCYEIQLRPDTRGKGIGKRMMEMLEQIGASWGMKKVMLTVQTENQSAAAFYRALDFFPDEISPSQAGQDSGADYEILSKRVAAAAASKPTNTP